jgi:biotin operon repressor
MERSAAPSTAGAEPGAGVPSPADELIESRLWRALGDDVALMKEVEPPPRFPQARERMLMCRLYLNLIRSIGEDFGAPLAAQADSASARAIGIYVMFRTMMCAPVHAGAIAHALKLPRAAVLHGLQQLMKHGYVERVGNAYRVTDKVNIPGDRVQARIEMIIETAHKLVALKTATRGEAQGAPEPGEP